MFTIIKLMTFQKYPLKTQLLLALIFTPLNIFISYLSTVFQFQFFMDMIFVYAASFFGLPCGIIVGVASSFFNAIVVQHTVSHGLYSICCITGSLLTWFLITRHKVFETKVIFWIRLAILFFISTIVISLEGSLIYSIFFSNTAGQNENQTVMFLTYTLVMQNLGLILSAFLARLPVNLFDKSIAVFGGFGFYSLCKLLLNVLSNTLAKSASTIAKKS